MCVFGGGGWGMWGVGVGEEQENRVRVCGRCGSNLGSWFISIRMDSIHLLFFSAQDIE